jgi:hypothetical protein
LTKVEGVWYIVYGMKNEKIISLNKELSLKEKHRYDEELEDITSVHLWWHVFGEIFRNSYDVVNTGMFCNFIVFNINNL